MDIDCSLLSVSVTFKIIVEHTCSFGLITELYDNVK